jgi:hypothetical protein
MPTSPSPSSERLGTPNPPAIRFARGTSFGASRFTHLLRPAKLLAPLYGSDRYARPPGAFTSRLPTDRLPSPLLDMTTTVTGTPLLAGLSPAGMAASLAAPEPYVRLSRIRLVWGFLCQGSITPFTPLLSFVCLLFCSTRAVSILPSRPHIFIAVARSGGQGRRFFCAAEGLSFTDASTAAGCRRSGGWPRDDPRGACHWPRSIARTTLVFG